MLRRRQPATALVPALLTAALITAAPVAVGPVVDRPGPPPVRVAAVTGAPAAPGARLPQPGRSRRTGLPVAVAVVALLGSASLWWRVARAGRW